MTNAARVYEALLLAAGAAAGTALSVALQRLCGRPVRGNPPGGMRRFLGRLAMPGAFLAALFVLGSGPVRGLARVGGRYDAILRAGVLFFAVVFAIHFADAAASAWFARKGREFPLPRILRGFVLAVLYIALFFAVLRGALGINLTPFLATSAILTMILGLAFQGVLSNILAGLSLHFTRSFARGDWIKVGEQEGVVVDTNWRETRILDRQSNIVVLPNNAVASATIVNFAQPDGRTALSLFVKASFRAPAARVRSALLAAAGEVGDVLAEPKPLAYILSYDETGVAYQLKFWVTDYARKFSITTEVAERVWYKFRRQGIEVPIALGDKVADVVAAVRPGPGGGQGAEEERGRNFADLLRSDFLKRTDGKGAGRPLLPEREIRELAGLVRRRAYAPGEVLFRQGDPGESCFVVARGSIRGEIATGEKGKRAVSEFRVGPVGLIGEMSLFTGLPRTATGVVEGESELIEIGAEPFGRLLARNPRRAGSPSSRQGTSRAASAGAPSWSALKASSASLNNSGDTRPNFSRGHGTYISRSSVSERRSRFQGLR
jgi:small-conductance mechanosensitive channel